MSVVKALNFSFLFLGTEENSLNIAHKGTVHGQYSKAGFWRIRSPIPWWPNGPKNCNSSSRLICSSRNKRHRSIHDSWEPRLCVKDQSFNLPQFGSKEFPKKYITHVDMAAKKPPQMMPKFKDEKLKFSYYIYLWY